MSSGAFLRLHRRFPDAISCRFFGTLNTLVPSLRSSLGIARFTIRQCLRSGIFFPFLLRFLTMHIPDRRPAPTLAAEAVDIRQLTTRP